MQCIQCKKEYESKRKTARFCSSKCRLLAFRTFNDSVSKDSVSPLSVSSEPVTDKPVSVTPEQAPVPDKHIYLTEKQISGLDDHHKELYERYITQEYAFTPNWVLNL